MLSNVSFRTRAHPCTQSHKMSGTHTINSVVVVMDTIWLGFALLAASNSKLCASEIGNAFLYCWPKEKIFIVAQPQFLWTRSGLLISNYMVSQLLLLGSMSIYRPSWDQCGSDLWNPIMIFRSKSAADIMSTTYINDIIAFSQDFISIIADINKDLSWGPSANLNITLEVMQTKRT